MNPEIYSLTTLVCIASTNGTICNVSHSVFPLSNSPFLFSRFVLNYHWQSGIYLVALWAARACSKNWFEQKLSSCSKIIARKFFEVEQVVFYCSGNDPVVLSLLKFVRYRTNPVRLHFNRLKPLFMKDRSWIDPNY